MTKYWRCHAKTSRRQNDVQEEPLADMVRPVGKLPRLRFTRFIASLRDKFACEVQQGKGSEVTLYRIGGKKCLIGHHGGNDPVYQIQVKKILKQLGISLVEWCEAVHS